AVWRGCRSFPAECVFPEHWRGTWFQSSVRQLIHISDKEVSSKGNCTEASGQKYVVHNKSRRCYQCVIFYEKHVNVIQYKESFCSADSEPPDLTSLCGHVTGDGQLYSMFRVDYRAIECPLRGPFSFSYSRGHMVHQECTHPRSRLERCNDHSRMLFRYQACVDVAGAEAAVEEMECMGMWKEGSARYLVTRRVSSAIATSEDRYRCFIYERAKPKEEAWLDYRLAESAEATCSGLFSTRDGTRRLKLLMVGSYNKCQFPPWTTVHRRWHSLDRRTTYQFNKKNTTLTVQGPHNATKIECAELVEVSTRETLLVVRATTGCVGGFQCMAFYRRDGHVMESQLGTISPTPEEACSRTNFPRSAVDFHTLVSSSQHHAACPHLGQYSVTGVSLGQRTGRGAEERDERGLDLGAYFSSLRVGCQSHDTMVLSGSMGVRSRAFSCQGSWRENDTLYLVASPSSQRSEPAPHFCFVYTVSPDGPRFSTVHRTCPRGTQPAVERLMAFNVTARAECLTGRGQWSRPLRPALALCALLAALAVR
ncbi:uncharacterized protein LOC119112602, partial [Pollicipes pollicipes]|uniref:uncharacterized protein LOC119112602 n=1 Tax=Pollicipes pollicipes TaxID=41117 RepID=UPI001884AAE5